MLDEGDVEREEALGAKGGRSYRYTAVRREESTQPQIARQYLAKAANSIPSTPDVEQNSATQSQQSRSPKEPQTEASKPLAEEGLEIVLWNKLRPTEASHKQPLPPYQREKSQPGNDACEPAGDSSNAREQQQQGKRAESNSHVSAPVGETQVHATSTKNLQVQASASSGTKGPLAQDPGSACTQSGRTQTVSSSGTAVVRSSTLASRSSTCLHTESASSRPARNPDVELQTSSGPGTLHTKTLTPDRGGLTDPSCRKDKPEIPDNVGVRAAQRSTHTSSQGKTTGTITGDVGRSARGHQPSTHPHLCPPVNSPNSGDLADKQDCTQKPALGVESGVTASIINLGRKTQRARELKLQRDSCQAAVQNLRSALQEGEAGWAKFQAQANLGRMNLYDLSIGMEGLEKQMLELQPRLDEARQRAHWHADVAKQKEREYQERATAIKKAEEQATRTNKELQGLLRELGFND